MRRLPGFSNWGLSLVLSSLSLLHAQTSTTPAADPNAVANPAQASQAPGEMTKKITDLVHAGKYTEAQQLTTGLLVAYPDDQRLIKAKALIEKMLAPSGSTRTAPSSSQPAQPAANANADQLTGMDKVDYDALIELGRQAQQTTDLEQQKVSLKQFMDQSSLFLQKHPDQMLLWQLRAQTAISLNDPMAGYEAGQKLLAAGVADSTDPNSRRLLAQLKNKGWLDKQGAEDASKQVAYEWILGNWSVHFSSADERGGSIVSGDGSEEFTKAGTAIEGYSTDSNGRKSETPNAVATILDSGDIRWKSVIKSCEISDNNRTMTIVFTVPNGNKGEQTITWLLHKD